MYIKNKIDISPLIEDYCIMGEDFTGAIIKKFNRPDEDVSGLIIANAVIGEEKSTTNMNRMVARNCNFRNSKWLGEVWARRADFRHTSFRNMFCPYMDYRYADLRFCDFCGAVFQIISTNGIGVKLSSEFFDEISKYWNIEIIQKKVEE